MSKLTKEAEEALDGATETLNQAFEDMAPTDASDERHVQAASAIVSAITALCFEVAALRDSNYEKMDEVRSALSGLGRR